jgi:hypothetical protein
VNEHSASSRWEDPWVAPPYEPLRGVRMPEGKPELGIEPGEGACFDSVYWREDERSSGWC